jgi:ribosome-associated heat shock protein Hsp15
VDGTRVDAWLWSVRIFRTRSAAADACRSGHVRVNGRGAKPATPVEVGDRVETRVGPTRRALQVVAPLRRRVGAAEAVQAYLDLAPVAPPDERPAPPSAQRERGTGRPTKRERREIDRLRGRDR